MITARKKITYSYGIGLESKEESGMVYQSIDWEYDLPKGYYFTKDSVNQSSIEIKGDDEIIGYASKPIAFYIEEDVWDSIEDAIDFIGFIPHPHECKPIFTQEMKEDYETNIYD
jgi:hypothetical protein